MNSLTSKISFLFPLNRLIFILVLLLLCFIYLFLTISIDNPTFSELKFLGVLGTFQFFFSIYSSVKTNQKLISPYVIFLIVLFVFQVGQTLMYGFDIVSEKDVIFYKSFSIEGVFKASLISLFFIAFFQIGSLYYVPASSFKINLKNEDCLKRIRKIGIFLCVAAFIPYYIELIHEMIISVTLGYSAIYSEEEKIGVANLQSIVAEYFVPGLICVYIGYSKNKFIRNLITIIFLLNSSMIFITGGRTNAVIILGLLLILYNFLVKSFSIKTYIFILIGGFFILSLIAGIAKMRNNDSRSLSDTYSSIYNEESSNAIIDAVSEMGSTIQCLIWTDEIINKNKEFRYGSTYIYSFFTLIPNLGFWEIHPAKKEAALGHWLMATKGLKFGPGFSMAAEAYLNFGYFGFIIFFLMGFFAAKIFGRLGIAIEEKNYPLIALILIFFWFSLKLPRNSFIGVIRGFFFYALPVYWYVRGYIFQLSSLIKPYYGKK